MTLNIEPLQAWNNIAAFLQKDKINEEIEKAQREKNTKQLNSILSKLQQNSEIRQLTLPARKYQLSSLYNPEASSIDRQVAMIVFRELGPIWNALVHRQADIPALFEIHTTNKFHYLSSLILFYAKPDTQTTLIKSLNLPTFIYPANQQTNNFVMWMFKMMSEPQKQEKLREIQPTTYPEPESPLSVAVRSNNPDLLDFFLQEAGEKKEEDLLFQEKCNEFGSLLAYAIWNSNMPDDIDDNDFECSREAKEQFATSSIQIARWFLDRIPDELKAKALLWQHEDGGDTLLHNIVQWIYPEDKVVELINCLIENFEKTGRPIQDLLGIRNDRNDSLLDCCATEGAKKCIKDRLTI